MQQVRFEGEYPDTVIQVIFVDQRRPGLRFGFNWETGPWLRHDFEHSADDPEWVASMMQANFDEAVECTDLSKLALRDDGIAWLNETPPDPQ